jgi:hypothetical protein
LREGGRMKATIEVSDRKEADTIRSGLADPAVRAFVIVMGALQNLPTERARRRVLTYVQDYLDENPGQSNA